MTMLVFSNFNSEVSLRMSTLPLLVEIVSLSLMIPSLRVQASGLFRFSNSIFYLLSALIIQSIPTLEHFSVIALGVLL